MVVSRTSSLVSAGQYEVLSVTPATLSPAAGTCQSEVRALNRRSDAGTANARITPQ